MGLPHGLGDDELARRAQAIVPLRDGQVPTPVDLRAPAPVPVQQHDVVLAAALAVTVD